MNLHGLHNDPKQLKHNEYEEHSHAFDPYEAVYMLLPYLEENKPSDHHREILENVIAKALFEERPGKTEADVAYELLAQHHDKVSDKLKQALDRHAQSIVPHNQNRQWTEGDLARFAAMHNDAGTRAPVHEQEIIDAAIKQLRRMDPYGQRSVDDPRSSVPLLYVLNHFVDSTGKISQVLRSRLKGSDARLLRRSARSNRQ